MTKQITITNAADILGVHPKTLRIWDKEGILTPKRRKGRRYRMKTEGRMLKGVGRKKIKEETPRNWIASLSLAMTGYKHPCKHTSLREAKTFASWQSSTSM